MAAFHMHECMIDIDAAWTDKSINVLTREHADKSVSTLVIARDELTMDLEIFVDTALRQVSRQLPRYQVLARGPREVGPITGYEVKFQWRNKGIDVHQHQVFVPVDVSAPAPSRRVVTFTLSGPRKFQAALESELDAILSDVKIRRI
jgi:hypothetical protein